MKILVTGAAGFIGAHVTKSLIERGHEVVGMDNFNDYYSPAYKQARVEALIPNVLIEKADITDKEALEKVFKEHSFDLVCHLAAQAGVRYSITNPEIYEKVNVGGTFNVLEMCRQFHVEKAVIASSSSVYGSNPTPWSEKIGELKPISPYGETKKKTEEIAAEYREKFGIKCVLLRFFTVYGPWGRPDMAYFKFAKAIEKEQPVEMYAMGNMSRDFTYIDDIVDGVVKAVMLDYNTHPWEIINLGNSRPNNLFYFVNLIESEMGKKAFRKPVPRLQPGDMQETHADTSYALKVLNWKPTTRLEDGIKKFVEWFKNEETQKILKKSGLL